MPGTGIVILAGGEGSRMGGAKPEALFQGRRLIDIAIASAAEWGAPIVLCLRRPGQIMAAGMPEILDREGVEGPLAGLLAAFEWAAACGVSQFLTLPCDMPFLPDDLLSRLSDGSARARGKPAVAGSGGRRHPVCTLWPTACHGAVSAYAESGRRSMAGALDACAAVDIVWVAGDADPFMNINTPEDIRTGEGRTPGARKMYTRDGGD